MWLLAHTCSVLFNLFRFHAMTVLLLVFFLLSYFERVKFVFFVSRAEV